MKQSPEERKVMERMAPGALSREGFLGSDTRRLSEIVDADHAEAVRAGTTLDALADQLRSVQDAAVAGLGTPVAVGEHLTALHREGMGRIPCPFGACGTFPKGEIELAADAAGPSIVFTPLSVHLLTRHGFCQGRGSRYRLEPAALARLFPSNS
jgi:hypothetical protein